MIMNLNDAKLIDGSGKVGCIVFKDGPLDRAYLEGADTALKFNQLGDLLIPEAFGFKGGKCVKYQAIFTRGLSFFIMNVKAPAWWAQRHVALLATAEDV